MKQFCLSIRGKNVTGETDLMMTIMDKTCSLTDVEENRRKQVKASMTIGYSSCSRVLVPIK